MGQLERVSERWKKELVQGRDGSNNQLSLKGERGRLSVKLEFMWRRVIIGKLQGTTCPNPFAPPFHDLGLG